MISVADALVSLPSLAGTPEGPIRATARLWNWLRVQPGETVWREHDRAEELGFVWMGELEACAAGVGVGRALAPEMIGEAAGFVSGTTRTVTLRATVPTVLLLLPIFSLRALRAQHHPLFEMLVDAALSSLEGRLQTLERRLAEHPGRAARFHVDADEEPAPCPDPVGVLRRLNGFGDAPDAVLGELQHVMPRRAMSVGERLCEEGDVVDEMWIVASGTAERFRADGGVLQSVGALEVGSVIGAPSLLRAGSPSLRVVCSRPGWLLRLDLGSYRRLSAETRLRLREAMIGSFAAQIRGANRSLHDLGPVLDGGMRAGAALTAH